MKSLAKHILEGLTKNKDEFIFDFDHDDQHDIIKLKPGKLKSTEFEGSVFLYQYEFESNASSTVRSSFFDYFRFGKAFTDSSDKRKFLEFATSNLYNSIRISEFDAIVFPQSRSIVNQEIIKRLTSSNKLNTMSFELIKEMPENIKFDYGKFEDEILNAEHEFHGKLKPRYTDKQKIDKLRKINSMLEEIKRSDYFSIANSVRGNDLKPYFSDFIKFNSSRDERAYKAIQSGNILLIDDVTTTGSTIKDILRTLRKINPDNKIVIFSIIGKDIG